MVEKQGALTGAAGRVYGYARVSSRGQNLDRQLEALAAFGVAAEDVFADKASGKNFERTGWRQLRSRLSAGDVLAVKSIDRLGRDYDEILEQWRWLTKEAGCAVVVLDMPLLDTREDGRSVTGRFISDIVLQLLSYVAQVERESIRQRQAEGIACAKAKGVRFGRPRKKQPHAYRGASEGYLAGRLTRREAAERCRVSVSTFDRWVREDGLVSSASGE
ncbi:recombinase family protein [Paratractidigestivibacter sp.]|uniref:recombinase family protein n=1 Tax=Paratractidigestivibacter sp. TaxID=2847316 RepID=UPI002AC96A4E|nr:recombinase family protein [Paratractidigestivibacter sp.]